MKYKYSRWQLFSKKLNVPRDVQLKIYNHNLSLKEFIDYDLIDKIPFNCLDFQAQDLAYGLGKDGLARLKTIDLDLNLVEKYAKNIKHLFYNEIPDNLVEIINQTIIPQIDDIEKQEYLTALFGNYFQMNNQEIKKFMDDYGEIINILLNNSRYLDNFDAKSFIKNLIEYQDDTEKINKYISQYTDKILANTHREYGDYRPPINCSNDEYKEIFKYSSMEDYLKFFDNHYAQFVIKELKTLPQDYVFNMSIPFSELLNSYVLRFIGVYGLKNIVDFDNECGHFFTNNNCEVLKLMYDIFMKDVYYERDSNMSIYTKKIENDENGNYIDRPYTKDEFYEAMRRMIVYGPRNNNYADKVPDYRKMTGEFRVRNADLFISEQAPEELQKRFYTNSITPQLLLEHPEYIQYLNGKDLVSCFKNRLIEVKGSNALYDYENIYKFIGSKTDFNGIMSFITEYSDVLDIFFNGGIEHYYLPIFTINDDIDKIQDRIHEKLRELIIQKGIAYPKHIPKDLIEKYPSTFLDKNAPQELQEAFYSRTISSEFILSNPSYREYLKNVDLEVLFKPMYVTIDDKNAPYNRVNLVSVIKNIFENEEALDVMLLYIKYIESIRQLNNLINFKINSNATKEDLLNELDLNIYQAIINNGLRYDDSIPIHFKNKYPSMFLDKNASEELKESFYNRTITLNDFNSNPNLLEMFNNINFFIAINEPKMIGKISKHLFFELINNYGYGFLEELKNNISFNQINKILTSQEELANELWEYTKENISLNTIFILKKLNFENEIIHKLELKIKEMCKVRPEFTENCPAFNIKLLNDDIIEKFGYGFISELLNYNSGAANVFLNQCNKDNIKKWIDYFKFQNMYDDKILHYMILNHTRIYYLVENLIQNNQNLSENDIIILKEIVKNNNEYDIQTIDDLNNYLEIKKKKLDDDVKSHDIKKVKNAVLKILYDIDLTGLQLIINEFGLNSDFFVTQILTKKDILTPEMIAAIETSKEIINENDIDKLQKYAKVGKIEYINFYEIENKLKLFYGNKLNISLTKEFTNNIQNIDGTLIVNYEGEDFKFLIHRLYTYDPKFSDFASQIIQDPSKWNTLDGATTLSTSMISNNHLKRVSNGWSLPQVYYGFSEINDDDLMFMGRRDIYVSHGGWQLEPTSNLNEYMDFNTLQYLSHSYNEVALQRKKQSGENKGKKIQPNCIICFNGVINEESIRAAKYFNIPICNIDEDKYRNREQINNIDSMLYKKNDNFINNLQQVIQYYNQEEMESLNSENLNTISEHLLDCLAFYTTHENIDKNQMEILINEINNLKNKKQNNMEEGIQYEGKSR